MQVFGCLGAQRVKERWAVWGPWGPQGLSPSWLMGASLTGRVAWGDILRARTVSSRGHGTMQNT